jgi:hypothetical protein
VKKGGGLRAESGKISIDVSVYRDNGENLLIPGHDVKPAYVFSLKWIDFDKEEKVLGDGPQISRNMG